MEMSLLVATLQFQLMVFLKHQLMQVHMWFCWGFPNHSVFFLLHLLSDHVSNISFLGEVNACIITKLLLEAK